MPGFLLEVEKMLVAFDFTLLEYLQEDTGSRGQAGLASKGSPLGEAGAEKREDLERPIIVASGGRPGSEGVARSKVEPGLEGEGD
ncbi:hypothetical protein KM043_010072 [Ampulex compressa]|nr:hypothetical protein KM043_010072 [Ampulex compressa]